jgi:cytoskeletal protein CcmA (bactofilin family)
VQSSIGRAITVKGSVHADEPIAISGSITGDVYAGENGVTVEPGGRVEGTITARHILVRGTVHGRLIATDLVRLEAASSVEADIAAPRAAIEEGATYNGRIAPARADAAARVAAYRQG